MKLDTIARFGICLALLWIAWEIREFRRWPVEVETRGSISIKNSSFQVEPYNPQQ